MPASLDCPQIEGWQALFGDTVPPQQRERHERHLESCPACRERLDRTLLGAVRRFGNPGEARTDPTLGEVLERLYDVGSSPRVAPAEPADLYFLSPAGRPDLLGTLGHYEVQEVIGQGGMGVVLKAFEPALHRLVAIKVMAPALAGSATARRRFTREAQAAAAVCHEHVVAVHGVHEADGLPYLVMQFVPGESLQARLDHTGPLDVEVVRIGMQTASGLAAAHAQGLIHRDIKPANLLLENGLARVKISDFGLARMVDDVQLTRDGVVAGTPEYMAPEQARGAAIDHRADLFSLGSVLYAMCTGMPPFRGATTLALLRQVSEQEPAPIRELNPEVSAWLEAVVMRLLAKEPGDRFQNAAEVAALLERYLAHLRQPTTTSAPELPPPLADGTAARPAGESGAGGVKWFRRRLWPGALLLVATLALSVFLMAQAAPPGGNLREPKRELREQLVHDFRGRPLPPEMVRFGSLEDRFITEEAEGLRITLPVNRADLGAMGLSLPVGVEGDFEITLAFEILKADDLPPSSRSYGRGLLMSVNEAARVGRLVRPNGSEVVTWDRWATVDGNQVFLSGASPGTARAGRLGLKRIGTTLLFLWSPEIVGDNFEEIHRCEFGANDITLLRLELSGNADRRPGALDVRLLELKVRSATPVTDQPSDSEEVRATRSKGWLVAGGILGLGLLLSLAVVSLVVRHRRSPRRAPAGEARPRRQAKAETTAPPLSFRCSGCGKTLKARAELAGKNVRCPHCDKKVPIPENEATGPGGTP
ncbi:MAG TPA: protein kinase [Gemmataceae bacterium]|nr:protein kinase [Gemmataceae bacterium]